MGLMEVSDIILLLEFCLKNTYFSFQDQFYEQVEGAAMGSPVIPIVANLYMEYLEQKALSTSPTPKFWLRYGDDTFVIHKEANKQGFLQHINSIDPAIRFTIEGKCKCKCKYPKWALDKVEKRLNRSSRQVNDGGTNNAQSANHEVQNKGHIVIPYTQGLCENIKKICGRYGIQTHFKGGRTIKNLLVSPKDKDPMVNQSVAIYWYQCGDLGCNAEYIGETSRTFGERYKEHLKPPSAIHHHSNQTGHTTNQNNFQIIGREGYNLARNIKESIYIRVNNPTLNNKFNLSIFGTGSYLILKVLPLIIKVITITTN